MSYKPKYNMKKYMKFITDKNFFPNCIECSPHYLDSRMRSFFHTETCGRGSKLSTAKLYSRMEERVEVFIRKHGKDGCAVKCRDCSNAATGTMQVFFHGSDYVVEHWPVCMDHAFHEDPAGRQCRYEVFS